MRPFAFPCLPPCLSNTKPSPLTITTSIPQRTGIRHPSSATHIRTTNPTALDSSSTSTSAPSSLHLLDFSHSHSTISTFSEASPSVAVLSVFSTQTHFPRSPRQLEFMSIENLKTYDPFAEADEDTGESKQAANYIHIRIQQRNGRKTLTTVQGLPKKFDQKKILKVIKKKFACNGTIVTDTEMGEVIQLQGDQRKDVQEFLVDKKEGLELDPKTIKVHGF
ncbi:translation initiation factor SUI1 [Xylariomycetidae sp. FL2044]|nr:translation initiation factor SUI1 [Xylariomycetidae sp. FL2044]KAH9883663.1 translation initiation factor SUI1 [Xylariomycetidae sp. FL2044]